MIWVAKHPPRGGNQGWFPSITGLNQSRSRDGRYSRTACCFFVPGNSLAVIIPTFNRVETLARALASIEAQTVPVTEVIVVDDGSSDNTRQMVERSFPKVRYYYQANQGVSAARNLGIARSDSQWVAFLDSDDRWLPEKLQLQLAQLRLNPSIKICHSDEIWIRHGSRVNPMNKHQKRGGSIFQHCLPLCAISPSSVILHRSLFDAVGTFDETLPVCEDYDLWLRITAHYPVLFTEQPLIVKYGGHPDQLSRRFWGMDRFRIQALEKIIDSGQLNPDDERAARAMLVKKATIYLKGARKRDKATEVAHYEALRRRYSPTGSQP